MESGENCGQNAAVQILRFFHNKQKILGIENILGEEFLRLGLIVQWLAS